MAGWRREDVAPAGILHAAAAGNHGVAWAYGILVREAGRGFATLIFRRHGHGWEQVEAPQIGRVNRALAVSDADIWAVGDGCSLHWDGSAWRDLPMPAVAGFWSLSGIAGASPEDLWAVGAVRGRRSDPLALHFDGQQWQRVPVPGAEGKPARLSDIAVLGSGDTWAAGRTSGGGIRTRQPFAVHWDGQEWTIGEVPEGLGQITKLASDGNKLWGLGYAAPGVPYVVALEGTSWQVIPGPPGPPEATTTLHDGTILPDGDLLTVGATSMPDDSIRPFAAILTSHP